MYQAGRVAVAADPDARPGARDAVVVGPGGGDAVGDQRGERGGGAAGGGRGGGRARSASALGRRAPTQARRTRVFRLGWLWLLVQALKGGAVPQPRHLVPEPWPDIPEQLLCTIPLH